MSMRVFNLDLPLQRAHTLYGYVRNAAEDRATRRIWEEVPVSSRLQGTS